MGRANSTGPSHQLREPGAAVLDAPAGSIAWKPTEPVPALVLKTRTLSSTGFEQERENESAQFTLQRKYVAKQGLRICSKDL